MAPSTEANRFIGIAPGTVWKSWQALPRWSDWQPGTTGASWQEGSPWAEGSTFDLVRRGSFTVAGRYTGRVLSTAPEQLLIWELRPTGPGWRTSALVESVRLAPSVGGTMVTITRTAHGPLPSLLSPLWSRWMQSDLEATLAGLHNHLSPVERRL